MVDQLTGRQSGLRPLPNDLGFDPDALREKYRIERDKRIRPDGNEQYREVKGDFSHYVDDPYVDPDFSRDALHDDVDVVIVGGGIGGLVTGARLRDAGVERIRVIEKAGDFAGTWYWNRYPGAQCDIESYIYLPLLEEMGYMPREKYSFQPEIMAYCQALARRYRLYDDACFQTEITEMRWDDDAARWVISTTRGDRMTARFVAMASGPLNRPKLPAIDGIETFKGHTFHTSRWDYAYTGGDTRGNLTGLADKRVGIIGTGATAVQCVPHVGAAAKHLYVFQRTPSSISERNNRPTDTEWASSLEPGWQRRRMQNFNIIVSGGHQDEDLVGDAWTDIFRNLGLIMAHTPDGEVTLDDLNEASELADFMKMEQVRARVDATVHDPETAESLKPYYRMFCKRPCFNDEYLPTFNRPNVTLVDTDGKGVQHITETGVIVDGKEYEVDCLIFATGFEVGTGYTRRAGYEIIGRNGQKLSDKWGNGLKTFHGFHSNGFPNMFFLGLTQTGFTANVQHLLREQGEHVAHIIGSCIKDDVTRLEATSEAELEWQVTMREKALQNEQFFADCTPGYYNNEGKTGNGNALLAGQYGDGPEAFFDILREWRDEKGLRGLSVS